MLGGTEKRELLDRIAESVGFDTVDLSELFVKFSPDKTSVFVFYSDFTEKGHQSYWFSYKPRFVDALCEILNINPDDTMSIEFRMACMDVATIELASKITFVARKELLTLDWSIPFETEGARNVINDSTVDGEDIGETVDKMDKKNSL